MEGVKELRKERKEETNIAHLVRFAQCMRNKKLSIQEEKSIHEQNQPK